MKIAIILPNLLSGGTQRAMVNIANGLIDKGIEVLMIVVNDINQDYSNNPYIEKKVVSNFVDGKIKTIYLRRKGIKYSLISIKKTLDKENPDILFSSLTYLNLYLTLFRFVLPKNILLICRETNILSVKHKMLGISPIYNFILRQSYKNADYFICQSKDMMLDLCNNFGIPKGKVTVIHNPVNVEEVLMLSKFVQTNLNERKYNIVTVGHLTLQKGQDRLIRAIHILNDPSIQLHLIGRGDRLPMLKKLTEDLGLGSQIMFHGFKSNPFELLSRSDLFVLSSQFEGFPNALIEAGVLGIPMVANDCKGGIKEIINKDCGYIYEFNLVEDLALNILRARSKNWNRGEISLDFKQRFSLNTICTKYEVLFQSLVANKN